MSSVVQVSHTCVSDSKLSAVFLHGLGGDSHNTWSAGPNLFWPEWLAEDIEGLAVFSVGYEASPSGWFGSAMPLLDRATNILGQLEAKNIADRPIVFICHSLGGLVAKQMLRIGNDFGNEHWKRIREQTKAIFFFATPHTGAAAATYFNALGRILLRPTNAVEDLRSNTGLLRDLNLWYRNKAAEFHIETKIFFETQATHGLRIVDETSADLGLPGVIPLPLDSDHLSICKPHSRSDLAYTSVKHGIERLLVGARLFTSPLQQTLTTHLANCKRLDVKFRSAHVILSLFAVPRSFAKACCANVADNFAHDFVERLERFISRQSDISDERGHVAVDLAQHPLISSALERAKANQRVLADEQDLFLAFLHGESGTNSWAKKQLGADKFSQLLTLAERQSVASMQLGVTDPHLFE